MSFQKEYEDYLMHYGVRGMKWGVRKKTYKSLNKAQRKVLRGVASASYEVDNMRNFTAARKKRINKKIAKYKGKGDKVKIARYENEMKDLDKNLSNAEGTYRRSVDHLKDSLKLKSFDEKNARKTAGQRDFVWNSFVGLGSGNARRAKEGEFAKNYFEAEGRYIKGKDGTYKLKELKKNK